MTKFQKNFFSKPWPLLFRAARESDPVNNIVQKSMENRKKSCSREKTVYFFSLPTVSLFPKLTLNHYWSEYTFRYTLRENYHFLLSQNLIKRPKQDESTPHEHFGKNTICISNLNYMHIPDSIQPCKDEYFDTNLRIVFNHNQK